ncbi:AAA family ATPase [Pseudomonas sp. Irchel 3E13]|uniref:AAA family ATPase n=1 Tax=Pseudomonas sp. Irchel 3E13 TaxID=2008975 RepID=UPI000BA388A1|nr:AAA family ATPase [Pseudomonas sp. Irchel 3E13]
MNFQEIVPMSVFGTVGSEASVMAPGFPPDHDLMDLVPSLNPHYFFRTHLRMPVMNFLYSPGGDALSLVGPTGSGKTSLLEQIAARLNWPFRKVSAHSRMEIPELVGSIGLECDLATGDQRTVFRYGPLAKAMREGAIFVLDEADVLDPAVFAGLNAVLEGGALVLAENGGEVIYPHPNFRAVITSNTRGQGDEHGLHGGTMAQNIATWDRYRMLEVPYLSKQEEMLIMTSTMPKVDKVILEKMVDIANDVRKQYIGNPEMELKPGQPGLTITFSTRSLLRWARIGATYSSNKNAQVAFPSTMGQALREALTNRADKAMRVVVHTIAKDAFGAAWGADPVLA